MYDHNLYNYYNCVGTAIEVPSIVIYFPGRTILPIELTCNVTGTVTAWIVNDTAYTRIQLTNGALPGHSRTRANILVNSPINNTKYICVSLNDDVETYSDPSYIYVAGECDKFQRLYNCVYIVTCLCVFIVLLPEA